MTPNERALEAMAVAAAFWDALGGDDDARVLSLLAPSAFDRIIGGPPYPGIARSLRDQLDLQAGDIDSLGWLTDFGILAGGGFRIRRTARSSGAIRAGEALATWPVDVIPGAGEQPWLVDPIRPLPRSEIGKLTVELRG